MKKQSKNLLLLCFALAVSGFSTSAIADPGKEKSGKITTTQQQKKGRTVTGTITDAVDGTPIIGANVMLKGTKAGTITDLDGNFSIQVNGRKDVLVVSYIGYKTREVPVEDLGVINIKLTSDNEMLDEVVIVGSGTQKKVSVTGAISTVKGLELKSPSSSLTSALAGRLAGVVVNTISGEPGAASEFFIRGISTFGGRKTPLILLDEVEISTGDLNNIPAETIESFSILKDASATAIYGARGANGVMLVTTKKGTENSKAKINITLENAFQQPMNFPEFVDGATWMELYNEASTTRGVTPRYTQTQIDNTRNKVNPYVYPDVDWRELIFKDMSMSQRANINISGGGSKVTYYLSLNVNHDSGLLDSPKFYSFKNNINNLAYNFQNNVQVKVTPTTKIRLNMNAQIRNTKGPNYSTDNLFQMTLSSSPILFPAILPAQPGDRHIRFGNATLTANALRTNPYAYMSTSYKQGDLNTLNTSVRIEQDLKFITKGLSANALVNFKAYSEQSFYRSIEPYYYRITGWDQSTPDKYEMERLGTSGSNYLGTSAVSKWSDRTIMLQFQLDYKRQFGHHNVGGMLMYMQRDYKELVFPSRNQGVSGRFTYDYGQRYLAEFNFGYNGTERLAKEDRFEFFPAMSLGWVVSNEAFFEPLRDKIDNLKLRGSYGLVGSDDLNYPYNFVYRDQVLFGNSDAKWTTGDNYQTTKTGPILDRYAVVDACWERSKKLDIGLDITLFRNWNMVFDYFYEKRSNILMQRASWPNTLGFSNAVPYRAIGKMDNWGYEFSTSYMQKIGKDFTLDFRGNFTYTQNKYVFKDEIKQEYPWQVGTGMPMSTHYGYVAEGLFTSQEEIDNHAKQQLGSDPMVGDIKYRDLNGDGIIDAYDETYISELGPQPRIQYGFGLNAKYKKWDLGIFFNGSAMRKINVNVFHPFGGTDYNVFQYVADNCWTEENPNPSAKYPRLAITGTQNDNNRVNSTYWLRNGNFLRLKQLELGYTFTYGRIYLTGDNLAVFSPFKEWDPELKAWYKYPLQRTVNVGLQLNF